MRSTLLGYWRQARPPQRFAYVVGAALIAVGVGHLVGWLLIGGAWAGPVSFRKPTTFGVSFGLTTITLAWVAGHLRVSDRARWLLLGPLAVADAYEVVWVSIQRWRGAVSHFNFDTSLDTGLFLAGGVAIAVTVTVTLVLTVLAFTAIQTTPSMTLAIPRRPGDLAGRPGGRRLDDPAWRGAGQRRPDHRPDHLRGRRGDEGPARGGHPCHPGPARPGLAAVIRYPLRAAARWRGGDRHARLRRLGGGERVADCHRAGPLGHWRGRGGAVPARRRPARGGLRGRPPRPAQPRPVRLQQHGELIQVEATAQDGPSMKAACGVRQLGTLFVSCPFAPTTAR